jgi:uncharacterized Ntn-hydrolase superfamily protein
VTFSIVARCQAEGMFGVAVASSSPAVAARCAHARAHAGAVASQNITDPSLGPAILDALAEGVPAAAALASALSKTPFAAYRQVLVLGRDGPASVHSGGKALGCVARATAAHSAAAGNLLACEQVPQAMVDAFEAGEGAFGARLMGALQAALRLGGEAGPIHSAGMLIVREVAWPIVDLRIDWSERDPLGELQALWTLYAPQIEAYVQRAVDPSQAPSFGVPGNL